LYAYVTPERSLELTSIHRQLFYWIIAAIALHVLAVLLHLVFKKENLVRALITGRKPATHVPDSEAINSSRLWLAVLIVLVVAGLLIWIVSHAPEPSSFLDASY
jgi:H+/Cl- antiporter ClcA